MSTVVDNSQPIGTIELIGVDGYQFDGDNATVTRKCQFISLYREHGSILHAAKLTPVNRKTVYRWIEADEQFAEAVADSKDECVEELETSVYRRAFTDSILAMFYLKAHRPQYRDKVTIDVNAVDEEIKQRLNQLQAITPQGGQFPSPSDNLQKEVLQLPAVTTTDNPKE